MARTITPTVPLSALPEFLRSPTVAEFVATALDAYSDAIGTHDEVGAEVSPFVHAQVIILRTAADETRKFHAREVL